MTNLTEQWKKGELPCGWHYIKIADIVFIDFFEGKVWKNKKDKYIDEVLAPVPSYEEYQKLLSDQLAKNEGEEINAELEELLKKTQELELELRRENTKLKKWCEEFNALDVAKENTKLKELLKQYKEDILNDCDWYIDASEKIKQINQVLGEE